MAKLNPYEAARLRRDGRLLNAEGLPISARTIVRDGLTRRERLAIAARDPRAMAALDRFDATTRHEICALCDAFKRKHG